MHAIGRRWFSRFHRAAFFVALLGVGLTPWASSATAGPGAGFDPKVDLEVTESTISIHDSQNRNYDLDAMVLLVNPPGLKGNPALVYGARTFNAVRWRNEDRIGVMRDLPLVGKLFSERIRPGDIRPENRVGSAYRLDGILIVDLRREVAGEGSDVAMPSVQAIRESLKHALAARADRLRGLNLGDRGGPPVEEVSVLNRELSQTLVAGSFVAQTAAAPFIGKPAGSAAGPAVSRIPVLEPWVKAVGAVYRSGGRLIVVVEPTILTQ